MEPIYTRILKLPVGDLILGVHRDKLCMCDWRFRKMRKSIDHRLQSLLSAQFKAENHPLTEAASIQLHEFLHNERRDFQLPLKPVGTHFQETVWAQLLKIGYGQTSTYLQLAKDLGCPQSVRAVANANSANAISIFIPCHRVIRSSGELGGYAGGPAVKRKLLDLEGNLNSKLGTGTLVATK